MKNKTQKEIIKDICIEFDCTQIRLAEKLGVSTSTVRKWSNGQSKIPNSFYKSVDFIREIHKLNDELAKKYSK
jgi:transcriptional regulator with XRE-family HTH domain